MILSTRVQHTHPAPCLKSTLRLPLVVMSLMLVSCVEDGFSPDCPSSEAYTDEDGEFDFAAWRDAAEAAGCVTPIGGPGGQSGGTP